MSNVVHARIEIDAPPADVLAVMLDPGRLGDWVTIHRRVDKHSSGEPREGYEMDQTLCLRKANFKVHWTLAKYEPGKRAVWEGRGPAHSHARTAYAVRAAGDGTVVEYENEFKAPGGFLGAAASRALMGGVPEREATRSLEQLKELMEK